MTTTELIERGIGHNCLSDAYDLGRHDTVVELKSLLRCRNYRGCVARKGCDGVCRIDSDICKNCENFGIPYSLLEQMQKGAENDSSTVDS